MPREILQLSVANITMACRDCFRGTLHEGTPVGRVETVHGLSTYVTDPPSGEPRGIIVVIPDAFGWELPNNRVLADTYAKRGSYKVYSPDFMDGHWLDHSLLTDLKTLTLTETSYFSKALSVFRAAINAAPFAFFNRASVTHPRVFKFFHELRTSTDLPIGVAGFCWGGKFVTLLCDGRQASNGKALVDVGFTAHPSRLDIPKDIDAVRLPYSVCIGDIDFVMGIGQVRKMEEVLKARADIRGRWELVVIEGARHGFAVRGNLQNEEEAKQCQQAEDQAVEWFKKWLGKLNGS